MFPFAAFFVLAGIVQLFSNPNNPTHGLVLIIPGSILLIPSAVGLNRYDLNSRDKQMVLRIVAVRSTTTVTEIIQETNLDREFILETIKNALLVKLIYGSMDDDETFVRDVSARPKPVEDEQIGLDKMGLFGN